jgi:hypothetical protein
MLHIPSYQTVLRQRKTRIDIPSSTRSKFISVAIRPLVVYMRSKRIARLQVVANTYNRLPHQSTDARKGCDIRAFVQEEGNQEFWPWGEEELAYFHAEKPACELSIMMASALLSMQLA